MLGTSVYYRQVQRLSFTMLRFYLLTFVCFLKCSALNFEARCPGVAIPACKNYESPEPDYYWRPYDGNIPDGAIVGGHDSYSNVTYIGQVPITSFSALNPATIYPGNKTARTHYYGVYFQDKDVKILCSGHPENFKWIRVKTDDLLKITDYHLVVGGFEVVDGNFLVIFVGRLNLNGQYIIGKVFTNESIHKGIKAMELNGQYYESQSFELLVYKKSALNKAKRHTLND